MVYRFIAHMAKSKLNHGKIELKRTKRSEHHSKSNRHSKGVRINDYSRYKKKLDIHLFSAYDTSEFQKFWIDQTCSPSSFQGFRYMCI